MDRNNIIDGKQKKHKIFFERMFTAAGWLFVLYSVIQIVFTLIVWLFNISNAYIRFRNNMQVVYTVITTLILSVVIFAIVMGWSVYNYRKYGKLNRRKFPKPVTDDELLQYFDITPEQLDRLKNSKVVYWDQPVNKRMRNTEDA